MTAQISFLTDDVSFYSGLAFLSPYFPIVTVVGAECGFYLLISCDLSFAPTLSRANKTGLDTFLVLLLLSFIRLLELPKASAK